MYTCVYKLYMFHFPVLYIDLLYIDQLYIVLMHTYISCVPHKNPSETPHNQPPSEDPTGSQERWCLRCHHEVGRGEFDYRDTWPPKRKQPKNGSKVIQYYNVLYIEYVHCIHLKNQETHTVCNT